MVLTNARRVLVTGADGFIGSHLVEGLHALGVPVRALVLYNSFSSWGWLDTLPPDTLAQIDVVAGDVRDPSSITHAMQGCNVVFHLAALISIPYSYYAAQSYVETNMKGTLNILQAARNLQIDRTVVTSTSEVYGTAQYVPIDEKHPLQAQSPYAATKIAADQLALSFYRSFDLPVVVLRPFNTFGPRQSLRAIVPTVITQLASSSKELRLGSPEPTRDLNYVDDIVRAFIHVADNDSCIGEVLNAGSGREISIGDLAKVIGELMQQKVIFCKDDDRIRPISSEVYRLLADSRRLEQLTGWQSRCRLEEGLGHTIAWFRKAENLQHYSKIEQYNV